MTALTLKTLCSALGFTVVILRGDTLPQKDAARRAAQISTLIEDYCLLHINEKQKPQNLINDLVSALEQCLACDGKLTWEVEQEAEALVSQVKSRHQ